MPGVLANWWLIPVVIAALALIGWWQRRSLHRDLERHAQELATLADVGRSIAQSRLDVDALCELIYRRASQIVDTTTFQIGLFEDRWYDIRIWLRDGERLPPQTFDLTANGGLVGWMRESRRPILVRDFELELDDNTVLIFHSKNYNYKDSLGRASCSCLWLP